MIGKFINLYKRHFYSPVKYARSIGVTIGNNCDIQDVTFGSEPYLIEIGNDVQITSGTKIFTHGAAWVLRKKYSKIDFFGKVTIKDNVYVGNNSLIMAGVTIGENVIVAAGSVVTKSVPNNSIVAGNPAKVIGDISTFEEKMLKYDLGIKGANYQEKKEILLSLSSDRFIQK